MSNSTRVVRIGLVMGLLLGSLCVAEDLRAENAAGSLTEFLAAPPQPLCPAPDRVSLRGATPPPAPACFCSITIDCEDGSTRSCEDSTDPCSCTGADQNCGAGQQGYAQCNGTFYYCSACPPRICTEGATRWVNWGCCSCEGSVFKQYHREQVCLDNQWVYTNNYGCWGTCTSGCA